MDKRDKIKSKTEAKEAKHMTYEEWLQFKKDNYDTLKALFTPELNEAYKKGYIDAGIKAINNKSFEAKQSE